MKARSILALAAAVFLAGLAAWWWWNDPERLVDPAQGIAQGGYVAPPPGTPSLPSVASPAGKARSPLSAAAPPARVLPPTLFGEFVKARQYKALYDRLHDSPEGRTPEGLLVLHEILRQCATVTEGRRWRGGRPSIPRREDFLAALAPGDPTRDKRIAAYDEFTYDRCAGFEGVSLTQSDLDRLLQDAAAAGDPRAKALTIEQELWRSRRQAGDTRTSLSDVQIESLKSAVATRDPEAIRVAGRVLSTTWNDYALRVGPDQLPVEPRPFMNAFLVLACEYGAPCGVDTPRMQQACALHGHCDASSYPDYLYQYASTPHDSNLVTQYRGLLRQAIESGDWSQINVVRGLPTAGSRAWFVPGPR